MAYVPFSPTPDQALLIELVDKNVSWHHIGRLLPQINVDASSVWDPQGNALIGMLVGSKHNRNNTMPDAAILDQILEMDPQALTRTNREGKPPTHVALYAFEERGSAREMGWWIENAPTQDLFSYVRRHNGSSGQLPGYEVASILLSREQEYPQETTSLEKLFVRGLDPNIRYLDKGIPRRPLATQFNQPAHWNAFLSAGGNPDMIVHPSEGDHMPQTLPLWQSLLNSSSDNFKPFMEEWAAQNRSDLLAQKRVADYWLKLSKRALSSNNLADIPALVTAHEDWNVLRDEAGANAAMYTVTMSPKSWKELEKKRYANLLSERDHQGRSLWNYALVKADKAEPDLFNLLAKDKNSADPSPVTGRGLLAELALHASSWNDALPMFDPANKALFKHTSPEQWLAVREEEAEEVAMKLIARGFENRGNVSGFFAHLIDKAEKSTDAHPLLIGAVALVYAGRGAATGTSFDRALALFQAGALISENPLVVDAVRERGEIGERLLVASEDNRLALNTPQAPVRNRSGMRL